MFFEEMRVVYGVVSEFFVYMFGDCVELIGIWMERVVYQERVSVEYLAVEEVEVRVMVCGVVVGVMLLSVSVN